MKQLYLFFFLSFSIGAFSQESKIIEGQILNPFQDLEGIHIINITLGKATITNNKGKFSIHAQLQDSVLVTSVHFKKKLFIVDSTTYQTQQISFYLDEAINELDEVVVSATSLTGNLTFDAANAPEDRRPNAKSLGLPNADIPLPPKEDRLLFATQSSGGLIPIGLLISAINGDLKRQKRNVALRKEQKLLDKGKLVFKKDYITNTMGIPEVYQDRFFQYAILEKDTFKEALEKGKLEFLECLLAQSIPFKEVNNLE